MEYELNELFPCRVYVVVKSSINTGIAWNVHAASRGAPRPLLKLLALDGRGRQGVCGQSLKRRDGAGVGGGLQEGLKTLTTTSQLLFLNLFYILFCTRKGVFGHYKYIINTKYSFHPTLSFRMVDFVDQVINHNELCLSFNDWRPSHHYSFQ